MRVSIIGTLTDKARATVDHMIAQLAGRAVVGLAFVVGAGFVTASASSYLDRRFGAEVGNLVLAGVFFAIGVAALLVVSIRSASAKRTGVVQEVNEIRHKAEDLRESIQDTLAERIRAISSGLSNADRDLVKAALAALGPLAFPGAIGAAGRLGRVLLRLALRNLPLVIFVVLLAYLMTRPAEPARTSSLERA